MLLTLHCTPSLIPQWNILQSHRGANRPWPNLDTSNFFSAQCCVSSVTKWCRRESLLSSRSFFSLSDVRFCRKTSSCQMISYNPDFWRSFPLVQPDAGKIYPGIMHSWPETSCGSVKWCNDTTSCCRNTHVRIGVDHVMAAFWYVVTFFFFHFSSFLLLCTGSRTGYPLLICGSV